MAIIFSKAIYNSTFNDPNFSYSDSKQKRKLLYLVLVTISLIVSSYYNSSNKQVISVLKNNNKVEVIKVDNKLILLDTGIFNLKSSKSFIDFQLIPKITKNFGLSNINTIISLKPSKQTCKTLCYFLKNFKVDYIYLSNYKKSIINNLNYIDKLKVLANKNNTRLILLDSNKYNLKLNNLSYIKLVEDKELKRSYYCYKIKAKIDNTLIYEYCN